MQQSMHEDKYHINSRCTPGGSRMAPTLQSSSPGPGCTPTWWHGPTLPGSRVGGDEAHHKVLVLQGSCCHCLCVGPLCQGALAAHLCGNNTQCRVDNDIRHEGSTSAQHGAHGKEATANHCNVAYALPASRSSPLPLGSPTDLRPSMIPGPGT
jgi:hypothetical protein